MVLGHGDIASVLPDKKGLWFFASGVSNSQCTDEVEYRRERDMLLCQPTTAHLVYFSSLSIFYSDTRYTRHKLDMEAMVKLNFPRHTIIRIGNISWGKNPHTLINYLKAHPEAEIRDEWRYIIDKDEFLHWVSLIPSWPVEMNCPGQRMKVKDIKEKYCV